MPTSFGDWRPRIRRVAENRLVPGGRILWFVLASQVSVKFAVCSCFVPGLGVLANEVNSVCLVYF